MVEGRTQQHPNVEEDTTEFFSGRTLEVWDVGGVALKFTLWAAQGLHSRALQGGGRSQKGRRRERRTHGRTLRANRRAVSWVRMAVARSSNQEFGLTTT